MIIIMLFFLSLISSSDGHEEMDWTIPSAIVMNCEVVEENFKQWNLGEYDIEPGAREKYLGLVAYRDSFTGQVRTMKLQRYVSWPANWFFPQHTYVWNGKEFLTSTKLDEDAGDRWRAVQKSFSSVLKDEWLPERLGDFAEIWVPPYDTGAFDLDCTERKSESQNGNLYLRYRYDELKFVCLGEFNIGKAWLLVQVPDIKEKAQFMSTLEVFCRAEFLDPGKCIAGSVEQSSLLEDRLRFESDDVKIWVLPRKIFVTERESPDKPKGLNDWDYGKVLTNKQNEVHTCNILIEVPLK